MTRRREAGSRLVLAAAALAVAGAGAARADEADPVEAIARRAGQDRPLVRIGLEPARAVELSSSVPFRVLDPATGRDVWKPSYEGALRAVADGAPEAAASAVYRVQVGSFGSEAAAEAERARLAALLGTEGVVRHDPDRGRWRVRVGRASDRLALNGVVERLRGEGVADLWIAEEPSTPVGDVRLRLVDAGWDSRLAGAARIVVVPGTGGRIAVDGTRYRGVIELRIDAFGRVRPIEWVGLETYLRGVVPRELGPEVWPQLEALKAQAVAARTYTRRNLGQFEADGFDLCATPRCQVYGGADAEHPLSDRAVAETRGEIVVWRDEPIVAYYTATCGGHTENGDAIFPESTEPYLAGVPCRAEDDALASLRGALAGHATRVARDDTGADVTRAWALLAAAGVLDGAPDPERARAPVDPAVLRAWTARLRALAGRGEPDGPPPSTATLAEAARDLVRDLGWDERATVLLAEQDLPALLRDPEAGALGEPARRALAYLAGSGALRPFADGSYRVGEAPSAGRLLPALAAFGETYRAFGLGEAVVAGVGERSVRLVRGSSESRYETVREPFLFSLEGGVPVPAARLELWPGDRVRYRLDPGGRIDFLELIPPVKGVSDDRVAAVYSWEVRKTRAELEASIGGRLAIGRLLDLQPVRRGVSGRITELRVVGSRATEVVRGFDVRRLLDLRESLTVIEMQRDRAGQIEAVVFAGKGWGHGVGLCQVGAYGMALRGAGYREILRHYYSGTEAGSWR